MFAPTRFQETDGQQPTCAWYNDNTMQETSTNDITKWVGIIVFAMRKFVQPQSTFES